MINDRLAQVQETPSEDHFLSLRPAGESASGIDRKLKESGQTLTWAAAALPRDKTRAEWIRDAVFRIDAMLNKSANRPMDVASYFAAVRGLRAVADTFEPSPGDN